MEENKMKLSAGIMNLGREIEIYEWLALTVGEYGTKPFNKRFETWLNKQSGERFGYHTLKDWGMNHESKDFENVRFSFHKTSSENKFELVFYYEGQKVGYDYDAKTAVIQKSNERESLLFIVSVDEIVEWANKIVANRTNERMKAQDNLHDIVSLTANRDEIKQQITVHNDRISYIIADELRVRNR